MDQLTKYYVMNHFLLGESLPVIPNVFHLTYIINRGAAFGKADPICKVQWPLANRFQ